MDTSSETKYMKCAENLISQCVSPEDDIEKRNLLDAEKRWFYTIFFQSLGKYIDVKRDAGQLDHYFWYARSVLLKYAEWMLKNEYPYLEKPEILEFPNETWSAQELRKSDILAHAACYAPDMLQQKLLEKSRFFFEICINQLRDFKTREFTRPVAILMTNGLVHMDAFLHASFPEEISSKAIDYVVPNIALELQKNRALDQIRRIAEVAKNTTLRKEIYWISQRLKSRYSNYGNRLSL